MISELWIQTCITASFWYDILFILKLITCKLQVAFGCSTYQMTALLSEMSIFCVRAGYEIQFASYASKHAMQCLSDKPAVRTYMDNLKTTGHILTFCISNDCCTIGDIPCVIYSCMRDLTGELRGPKHASVVLWYNIACVYSKLMYTLLFADNYAKFTYLMTVYYTPNDSFTAKGASFYKNKVG